MDKPRTFWILWKSGYKNQATVTKEKPKEYNDTLTQVIEIAAVEQLKAEIAALKSKLAKAKEALEFYADKNKWNTMYYVKDCFAAIGPDDLTGNHFNINDKSYGGKKARQALSEIGEG